MKADSDEITSQARQWLLRMSSGEANDADRAKLQEWLSESPDHAREFERLSQFWSELDDLSEQSLLSIEESQPESSSQRAQKAQSSNRWSWGLAASLLIALSLTGGLLFKPFQSADSDPSSIQWYSTAHGELETIGLNDGSEVTLGAHSRLKVEFSDTARQLSLTHGEAFFEVAKDSERPFTVRAGKGYARAVGTAFSVQLAGDRVDVQVAQGIVTISAGKDAQRQSYKAGQHSGYLTNGELLPTSTINTREVALWRNGKRVYRETPLRELVADLNRYSQTPIILANHSVGEVAITASFDHFNQTDVVLAAVTDALPVQIVTTQSGIHIRAQ